MKKNDCVVQFLRQVQASDEHIHELLEQHEKTRDLALHITTAMRDTPAGGGSRDKLGECVARLVDLQNEINGEIENFINQKHEVRRVVGKLRDGSEAHVIYSRYFRYNRWGTVAAEMGLTEARVMQIHGNALEHLRQIIENGGESAKIIENFMEL